MNPAWLALLLAPTIAFGLSVDEAYKAMLSFQGKAAAAAEIRKRYDALIAKLAGIPAEHAILGARELIAKALSEHRDHLAEQSGRAPASRQGITPLVRSSSAKLIQAYNLLMQGFPKQGGKVKKAFFDHLCALDFI